MTKKKYNKVKNPKLYALKVKAESNSLGLIKTVIVLALILLQTSLMILSSLYILNGFQYYGILAFSLTIISCIHVLSSTHNGQSKATWVLFLLICYSFGYFIYFISNEKILFSKSRKKYEELYKKISKGLKNNKENDSLLPFNKNEVTYLYKYANAYNFNNSKIKYFPSGASFFDQVLEALKKAKNFIFIEFFIISDGVLLKRFLDVLNIKIQEGVDVRIIYDDMGCHGKLKRKTKKLMKKNGIKLQHFNRFIPVFDLAMNFRDHRKIIIIDGKIGFTGGANLADEYINEKQIFGYWKDSGVMVKGSCVDNLTLSFLCQWEYLTKSNENYYEYFNKYEKFKSDSVVVPFVSGPEFKYSIAKDMYINVISSAKKYLNIMTPYFIPEETIINLLIAKAKSGVNVNLFLPAVADKKLVYIVSRDYAERLISSGINVYTMVNSFVHSKVISNEHCAIIGSINVDHRSFNQQLESAVFTDDEKAVLDVKNDFDLIGLSSEKITPQKRKRNNIFYKIFAGIFRLISPFM